MAVRFLGGENISFTSGRFSVWLGRSFYIEGEGCDQVRVGFLRMPLLVLVRKAHVVLVHILRCRIIEHGKKKLNNRREATTKLTRRERTATGSTTATNIPEPPTKTFLYVRHESEQAKVIPPLPAPRKESTTTTPRDYGHPLEFPEAWERGSPQ